MPGIPAGDNVIPHRNGVQLGVREATGPLVQQSSHCSGGVKVGCGGGGQRTISLVLVHTNYILVVVIKSKGFQAKFRFLLGKRDM